MLTADELDQVCDVLIEHEGLIPWLYCDMRGFVTVGVGDKVTPQSVLTMPFVHKADSTPADQYEKRIAFIRVQDSFRPDMKAYAYTSVSDLRLDAEFCRRRLQYRVKSEFVPTVAKHIEQFEQLPLEAKLVLVDIAYNVGSAGFARFAQLIEDCNRRDFAAAALQVHTSKKDEDPKRPETWGRRNNWRRLTMLRAAEM